MEEEFWEDKNQGMGLVAGCCRHFVASAQFETRLY